MRLVAIIQARMGSTRLPGKVLMPLAGKPVIQRVVERISASRAFDEIVVATTTSPLDDGLAKVAGALGATVVRGDEFDVLGRFVLAAEASSANAIMRITADCPLIDPDILAQMARIMRDGGDAPDLVTNARARTYPRGLDAELFTRRALDIMAVEAEAPHEREHVTPFLYANPGRFHIRDVVHERDLSELRWTLDTAEDFDLLEKIYGEAADSDLIKLADVLSLLAEHPDWSKINAHIEQKRI